MGVLSSRLLQGRSAAEGEWSRGGRQWRWNLNDAGYERWKWRRGGDGVRIFSVGKRGRRRGGSTITEADDTAKSGAAAGEAEGGSWHLDVEYDQRKLGL
jgi:hypothetical protein